MPKSKTPSRKFTKLLSLSLIAAIGATACAGTSRDWNAPDHEAAYRAGSCNGNGAAWIPGPNHRLIGVGWVILGPGVKLDEVVKFAKGDYQKRYLRGMIATSGSNSGRKWSASSYHSRNAVQDRLRAAGYKVHTPTVGRRSVLVIEVSA